MSYDNPWHDNRPVNPYAQPYGQQAPFYATPPNAPVKKEKRGVGFGAVVVASLLSAIVASTVTATTIDTKGPAPVVLPQISSSGVLDLESPALASALNSVFTVAVSSNGARGTGSGVAIDANHIVTNAHVVNLEGAGGTDVRVEVQDAVGNEYAASVVGVDTVADVAVLNVKEGNLVPLKFGDSSSLTIGQGVIAVGAPLGLSNTVTSGIVSALDRPVLLSAGESLEPGGEEPSTYINAVQTDAAVNSGNSGGALINADGQLVGLNVAISTASGGRGNIGIGYAIPASYVKRVSSELIKTGEATHGILGVRVITAGSVGGNFENGARVAGIEDDSPASRSDLRERDVVIGWDGKPVASSGALIGFTKSTAPGTDVTLTVRRNGREVPVKLTLGSDAE